MTDLPNGGRVLDTGCGHGEPVIGRLLDGGFSVSGIDISPVMLQSAKEKYPRANFSLKSVNELDRHSEFDGICSFSSLLYFDPIDLSQGIYHLHQALKPDGLLFLFACDLHADWRGHPLSRFGKQPVWEWMYNIPQAVDAVEKLGYFKVIEAEDVTPPEVREDILAEWRKNKQDFYERQLKYYFVDWESPPPFVLLQKPEFVEMLKKESVNKELPPPPPPPDLTQIPELLDNWYVIIARKQTRS